MLEFVEHRLELPQLGVVRALVENIVDKPTFTVVFGGNISDGCLVRIHSRCLYGDVFHSHDCDCGEQLERSVEQIRLEGSGIIIYLDQEGRNCGLANKAHGYVLTQNQKMNTFEAYVALGLKEDAREYVSAVRVLNYLDINSVRLLSNNPSKVSGLETAGIEVERIPIIIPPTKLTESYLTAKKRKGHLL